MYYRSDYSCFIPSLHCQKIKDCTANERSKTKEKNYLAAHLYNAHPTNRIRHSDCRYYLPYALI